MSHPDLGLRLGKSSSVSYALAALCLDCPFQPFGDICSCDSCVQVCEVSAESQVRYELETRFQQLQSRLAAVTLETEEVFSSSAPSVCEDTRMDMSF